MPTDNTIDFDATNSDLQIGIEIEYPTVGNGERLVSRGNDSQQLQSEATLPPQIPGRCVYDGTVGAEFVSEPLDLEDVRPYYADVIEFIEGEYGRRYQPVGLLRDGSTAGTHIHLSPLSRDQALELADLSSEPWMQILFCSSIAASNDSITWPVFRGGRYCQMGFGREHYDVVNGRSGDHYEWRLPEPMTIDHIDILVKFLRAFEQSTEAAVEYAQKVLDDADDRITAIQRAERVGMDIESMPEVQREPYPDDPENLYEAVANAFYLPEINRVDYNGQVFYMFSSDDYTGTVEVQGIEVPANGIIYADSLQQVEEPSIREEVLNAVRSVTSGSSRETEATKELKGLMKKKKS